METFSSAVEQITPTIAKQMLEQVFSNAKVDAPSRESFARDMAAGSWVLNGSPIVFATGGALLDGRATRVERRAGAFANAASRAGR